MLPPDRRSRYANLELEFRARTERFSGTGSDAFANQPSILEVWHCRNALNAPAIRLAQSARLRGAEHQIAALCEVMSPGIKYVLDDETTEAAAQKMSKLQVRRLPVLNRQKRLVGILALGDLAVKR
jgi:CBS domain-containing protein